MTQELLQKAQNLFNTAKQILSDIDNLINQGSKIENLKKLRGRIFSEYQFLKSLLSNTIPIKKSHVINSNLARYKAIVDFIKTHKVDSVSQFFKYNKHKFEVDIVCCNGLVWIKMKVMKASTIKQIYLGMGTYGDKCIVDTAKEMIQCAKNNQKFYETPKCIIQFYSGCPEEVRKEIENLGIIVQDVLKEGLKFKLFLIF